MVAVKLSLPRPAERAVRVTPLEPPEVERTRLGTVVAMVGVGLFVQGAGDALARTGHERFVLPLVLGGLVIIFAPCAWRLASTGASRNERIGVALVLGSGLLASYLLRSPLILDGFDELGHGATLVRLFEGRSLFITNTGLPISPYYPGLELLTVAARWLTGLPLALDQVLVLAAARIALVLCVFLVVERVARSSRAGGIGVLVYAANPQFYSFDAQYAYETLALAFGAAVVYLVLCTVDVPRPRLGRSSALALGAMGALAVTHHLTSWLTVGLVLVWAVGLYVLSGPAVPSEPDRAGAYPTGDVPTALDRVGLQVGTYPASVVRERIVGLVAVAGLVVVGAWTAFVGNHLTGYVGPIFQSAADNISSALGHLHGNRQLFHNAAGGGSPGWEIALMLAAAASWCLILVVALYSVIWRKSIRGGALRYVPAVIAAAYPLALLTSVSASSKEVGGRAMTFIFFGMAVIVGGWLATRLSSARHTVERVATVVVACVCFVGSTLFGGGPLASYVPGPYLVGADERSVSAPSIAVARWAAANLPVDAHVAADRDNGELLDDLGRVDPVTAISGLDNPAPIFFDQQFNPYDEFLIRQADIRYIVIDTRLTQGLPLYGTYIAEGESKVPIRLTSEELGKIASVPGVRRIYDNGAIQVYDLSSVLGRPPLPVPASQAATRSGTGVDLLTLVLAALVALVWGIRLWRRRGTASGLHRALCGLVAAMVGGLFGAGLVLLLHLRPGLVSAAVLLVLLVLGLVPLDRDTGWLPQAGLAWGRLWRWLDSPVGSGRSRRRHTGPDPTGPMANRRLRAQVALGCAGLALLGLGASLAIVSARREWVPPPELSLTARPGGTQVAGVQLGSAGPVASRLDLKTGSQVLWSAPLAAVSGPQDIVVPGQAGHPGSRLVLVVGGHPLRQVGG